MAASHGKKRAFGLFATLVEMDEDSNGVVTKIDVDVGVDVENILDASEFQTTSSPSVASYANHWTTTLLVTFSIITVTINLLLLLLFTKRRSLRTVSNRFVINLLFISLLSSAILVPFVILDLESHTNQNGGLDVRLSNDTSNTSWSSESTFNIINIPSMLAQFTLNFICTASILSILLIGVDQYLAVLHPLRCHSYMNKPKSLLLILTSNLISLTSSCLVALMNGNASFFPNLKDNPHQLIHVRVEGGPSYWLLGYGVFYLGAVIVTPFITICIIYVLIYRAAHRNSARLRRSHFETPKRQTLPKVQSAPNFITSQIGSNVSDQVDPLVSTPKEICSDLTKIAKVERTHSDRIPNILTSLKTKISNASAFRYREENRTAKISIIVIVMVLACYAPYGVMYLLSSISSSDDFFIPNRIAIILLISSNLWSPILFALRNRRVQRELKKFLTLKSSHGEYPVNRRQSRPQIVIQDIETTLNKHPDAVQIEPFLANGTDRLDHIQRLDNLETNEEFNFKDFKDAKDSSKSILKRVCSKNWGSYKKCSFINVPDGCLDARGSFSSASTQISTED